MWPPGACLRLLWILYLLLRSFEKERNRALDMYFEPWIKLCPRDFSGDPVVKNPPSNAGDVASIPGQGTKISHTAGQLSLCTTAREACVLQ